MNIYKQTEIYTLTEGLLIYKAGESYFVVSHMGEGKTSVIGQSLTQAEAGACVEGLATSVCYPPCS